MKKLLLYFLPLLFSSTLFSQTIVSTTPENRNAILEEFTGVNCGFCPQGHAIANGIKANNPDDFFVINVHSGGFANPGPGQPDFRTPFGQALDNQANVAGYPAGTINRTLFPSFSQNPGGTAMSRNRWNSATNQILAQPSYVNVGVEAEIDVDTNLLTVHVEAYYTGDSPEGTNKLNVALLQNNTLGPQAGGNMGDEYVHMHRLVHLLTGQWGIDINTTTQGSFVDETFTYTIPADYNGIPADIYEAEMEVVAFITETHQDIISGNGAAATYLGLEENDRTIKSVDDISDVCDGAISPVIKIQNLGTNDLNTVDIEYAVNGEAPQIYTWNGNIGSLASEEVQLPEILFNLQQTNQVVVSIPNDDDNSNNSASTDFNLSEIFETTQFNLSITLDNYPSETTWDIKDSAGIVIHSGGPYSQAGQTVEEPLDLVDDDCYTFTIYDAFGDGICCQYGNGSYTFETSDGELVIGGGDFSSSETKPFSNYNTLSINSFNDVGFSIYPNPTQGILNISATDSFDYQIFDIQGKMVMEGGSSSLLKELNLSSLMRGTYIVKVNIGKISKNQKLILK